MIDDPEKTRRLLEAMRACLPFEVQLTPRLVQHLRLQAPSVEVPVRHQARDVSYAGDEGGIMCHLDRGDGTQRIVTSLTHLHLPPTVPAAAEATRYQKHRIKRLKALNRG